MLTSPGLAKDNYDSSVVDKNGYTTQKDRFISRNENNVFFLFLFFFFFFYFTARNLNLNLNHVLLRERERERERDQLTALRFPFLFVFLKLTKLIKTREVLNVDL